MGFVSFRLAPRKRPCTNIIVYQCRAIVGPVPDVPASCQIRQQQQGCCSCLAFTAPTPKLAWPLVLLSLVSSLYNDPTGDWPRDSPQEAPPGLSRVRAVEVGGRRAQSRHEGPSSVVDSGLTLACSPPLRSGLELRGLRSPAENRVWAAIQCGWSRSCVRLSADHWRPNRSARPGSCCWPQIRVKAVCTNRAFCSADKCEKSQLAGIRLHCAVAPELIILISLLLLSPIPRVHQGMMVRITTSHAALTLGKSRWRLSSTLHMQQTDIYTLCMMEIGWCKHLNVKTQTNIPTLTQIPLRTFCDAACLVRSSLICAHLSAWWMRHAGSSTCLSS